MYADSAGAKWLKINGLESLYDEIDTQALDAMPKNINHAVFWAAGKIYAYQAAIHKEDTPIFMDTDAILWEKLDHLGFTGDLVAAHWESFSVFEGFNMHHLHTPKDYQFPKWASILQNKPLRHLNASFLWFKNKALINMYLFESKRFMTSNPAFNANTLPNWVYMCFAEQVLLADTALFLNKKMETLGDLDSEALNARFSHLWGAKKMILQNKSYENALFEKCLAILRERYLGFDFYP
jgi:hypothetical protein